MWPLLALLTTLLGSIPADSFSSTFKDYTGTIDIQADEGIRYAKADYFEKPARSFTKEDDGNYEKVCPQMSKFVRSTTSTDPNPQDCLLLNIYRRQIPSTQNVPGKPVVVYLHPGMFHWGSKDLVGPRLLLGTADVVLVTVNYRLGALGFLSTNETDAPGNMGLWDQNAALSWVKDNINQYGGDSGSITLMGHGAGAASVGLHLLHAGGRPQYFHRAVMISGGPLDPWVIQRRPREEAEILAERLKCPKSRNNMVRCIASRGAKRIVEEQEREPKLRFGPVIDTSTRGNFLEGDPQWLLTQRTLPDIPILLGHTGREGSYYFYENPKDIQGQTVNSALGNLLRPLLNDSRNLDSIAMAVKYHYHIRGKENASSVDAASAHIIQALTDFLYASGADKWYRLSSEVLNGKTYRYIFNYTSQNGPSMLDFLSYANKEKAGATHLNDLFFYFDTKMTISKDPSSDERSTINTMSQIIYNFVRDQAPPNIRAGQEFRLANQQQEDIFVIENPQQGYTQTRPKAMEWRDRMDLWNILVPELESVDINPGPDPELEHFRSATWGLTAFLVILLVLATLAGLVVLYRRKQRRPASQRDSNLQGKELAKL